MTQCSISLFLYRSTYLLILNLSQKLFYNSVIQFHLNYWNKTYLGGTSPFSLINKQAFVLCGGVTWSVDIPPQSLATVSASQWFTTDSEAMFTTDSWVKFYQNNQGKMSY